MVLGDVLPFGINFGYRVGTLELYVERQCVGKLRVEETCMIASRGRNERCAN